jgi:hypothetical protein
MQNSPFQTTTFRLTVLACLAFIALGGAVLGLLYWRMLSLIDGQINGALQRECSDMSAAYERGSYEPLAFPTLITGGAASLASFFLRVVALASLLRKNGRPLGL